MPMRSEEIEELMHSANQQKITMTVRDDSENGHEPLRRLPDREPLGSER